MDASFGSRFRERVEAGIAVQQALLGQAPLLGEIADALVATFRQGGRLFLFGNGGSAADAAHIAAEFTGRFYLERQPLPAIALGTNISSVTAIGNDYGFEHVFSRELRALAKLGDAAIAISTSGRSPNVIRGLEAAREIGVLAVALTGGTGGDIPQHSDYCVCVPSPDTPRIQEAHAFIAHTWAEFVEEQLFGSG